jgi:hypothetical protein
MSSGAFLWSGFQQRGQHRTSVIGEHQLSRVVALHQIPDQHVPDGEGETLAFSQSVPEARQNSSTRSGTVSPAAMVSGVGVLAMNIRVLGDVGANIELRCR